MPQHSTRHTFRHQATIEKSHTTVEKTLATTDLLSRGTSATTNAIAVEIVVTIVTTEIANEITSATAIEISTTRIGHFVVPHFIERTGP